MKCISVLSKYFPTVTYVVGYVIFSVVMCVVNHATLLFNSTVTFLNLPPTVGPKHPNDESTTCNHNDGSLCRWRELMRTATGCPDYYCGFELNGDEVGVGQCKKKCLTSQCVGMSYKRTFRDQTDDCAKNVVKFIHAIAIHSIPTRGIVRVPVSTIRVQGKHVS